MKGAAFKIIQENLSDEQTRKRLIQYLRNNETQALFILGNLLNNFRPSVLYGAYNKGVLGGVCGFYPTFHSAVIFSEAEEASKAFGLLLVQNPRCSVLLGMSNMVEPVYEVFLASGRRSTRNPKTFFLNFL